MKKLFVILLLCFVPFCIKAQSLKKVFKFSTFYVAANGGTSISDKDVFSVAGGLSTTTVETPFDYSFSAGVRKIARFGYESRNTFYDGTESTVSDASTLGKVNGFEFLFEGDYRRQLGVEYIDMHHFLRYAGDHYVVKGKYNKYWDREWYDFKFGVNYVIF